MSLQATIKRYSLIIDFVRQNHLPSFAQIHEMLKDGGLQYSRRTLQRDIEDIRIEFGIELSYDLIKKGYFIDYEKSLNFEHVLQFLELALTAGIMIDSLKDWKEAGRYIDFDSYKKFRGLENINNILVAIRKKLNISFSHTSFQTGKKKVFIISPYLLKEYEGRWYVYGKDLKSNDFKMYGLDRISDLKISTENYVPDDKIDIKETFSRMIGITGAGSDDEKEDIVLSFTCEQWKYYEALPWFFPYKVLTSDNQKVVISFNLIPNIELTQTILKHSDSVTVIQPEDLRIEIKNILKQASKRYS